MEQFRSLDKLMTKILSNIEKRLRNESPTDQVVSTLREVATYFYTREKMEQLLKKNDREARIDNKGALEKSITSLIKRGIG